MERTTNISNMSDFQAHDLQPELLAQNLVDVGYLGPHMSMDGMAMMQDLNFITTSSGKLESMDGSMTMEFDENDHLNARRSISYGGSSVQSQSPPLQTHFSGIDIPQPQPFTNPFTNSLEQVSPITATDSSRRDSEDDGQRAERRRAQNRAAQRAYRQRKDQSLKQREREIETLREELDKAQRLNRTLCKVVAVLRERIKNPPAELDET